MSEGIKHLGTCRNNAACCVATYTIVLPWTDVQAAPWEGTRLGRLTTHVLDIAHGCAGDGVFVRLYRDTAATARGMLICEMVTNKEGRCEVPLLAGDKMCAGRYVLVFAVAAYFRSKGVALTDPPFLENVHIHFGIASADANYHVPLLISPYAYSTYRGT